MATSSSTSITTPASTANKITNLSIPLAATEVSLALSSGLKKLLFRLRSSNATLQYAFISTESGTKFITLEPNTVYYEENLNLTGVILFVQADKASQTLEVLEWF